MIILRYPVCIAQLIRVLRKRRNLNLDGINDKRDKSSVAKATAAFKLLSEPSLPA